MMSLYDYVDKRHEETPSRQNTSDADKFLSFLFPRLSMQEELSTQKEVPMFLNRKTGHIPAFMTEWPRPSIVLLILIIGTVFPNIPFLFGVQIMVLAFVQNVAYSLQSRAGNRSSNLYHLVAAILASLVFFLTLRSLVVTKVTFDVLLPYIFGTMLGSMYGTSLSTTIETKIGAAVNLGQETKGQTLPLRPAVIGLSLLLFAEFAVIQNYNASIMVGVALTALVSNLLFAALRVARNTNAYWFHLVIALIHAVAGFSTYYFMVKVNMDWYLFAPYATGAVLGSMIGAETGKRFGKYIKASWDAHDLPKDEIPLPVAPIIACLFLLLPHWSYFGFTDVVSQAQILGAALLQTCAFTVVSRARQRGHLRYLEWSSLFSNGIWFITLNILVVNKLPPSLLVPYLVGTGVGSLWGQAIAMKIEPIIGAFMDSGQKKGDS